ncbi:MAG: DUF4982 domain-containing protein [Treponema sp.]|jgi:beta-galactosidase|nr:DUF4982 domain-containing protein [Treponema sp.]
MKRELFNSDWMISQKNTVTKAGGEEAVTLPHDAMIGQTRGKDAAGGRDKGFFPYVQCEYRKTFTVDAESRDKRLFLEFEGVYMNAGVFINGELAGRHPYGYSNFYIALDPYLNYGGENTVKVSVDTGRDSRWYSGAGIYRNVWLITGELCHFALNGVNITTEDIGDDYAVIAVENILKSADHRTHRTTVLTELVDNEGKTVARDKAPVTLYAGERTTVRQRILVKNPRLWDTESPYLYTCKSVLALENGEAASPTIIDTEEHTFGIRILRLDTEHGLRINGKTVKLRGACIHHDNGVLGTATFDRAEERRAEILKRSGFNALRSAHHPMSKEMLAACDRLGLLVMDEAFDVWTLAKTHQDYSRYFPDWWERDIEAMVHKDYNHPCVVLYSIGNEIIDAGKPHGTQWGRKLAEKIRSLDKTRYTINSINPMLLVRDFRSTMKEIRVESEIVGKVTEESYSCVDVSGYNYTDSRYEMDSKRYPNRIICGSETFSKSIASNWAYVERMNNLIGDFTWTGWDYLGEAGIGNIDYDIEGPANLAGEYPWITASCGDIDSTGFRLPVSYYREIVWGLRQRPYIAVLKPEHYGKKIALSPWAWNDSLESWTWPGFEGKPIQVEVYSPDEEVALLINGKELERLPAGKANQFKALFTTTYQPGKLEAVAYSGGTETGRCTLLSAAPEIELSVTTDRETLGLNRGDLAYLSIALTDRNGTVNTALEKKVSVSVEGAGVLQGLGSANPITEEPYTGTEYTTFHGRALALIRPETAGTIRVRVEAAGCPAKSLVLQVRG